MFLVSLTPRELTPCEICLPVPAALVEKNIERIASVI